MVKRQVTLRLTEAGFTRLCQVADRSGGLSLNKVGSALLERALAEGWTVRAGTAPVAVDEQAGPPHT